MECLVSSRWCEKGVDPWSLIVLAPGWRHRQNHQSCSCIILSGSRHHTPPKIIEPEILAAQFVLVLIWLLAGESQGKFKVGCVSVGEWWGGVLSSAAGTGGSQHCQLGHMWCWNCAILNHLSHQSDQEQNFLLAGRLYSHPSAVISPIAMSHGFLFIISLFVSTF